MEAVYLEIFGLKVSEYIRPDVCIPAERKQYIPEVLNWGRSQGSKRLASQPTSAEMDAIASVTGSRIPATPAQA